MPMAKDDAGGTPDLTTTRNPVGPSTPGAKGTAGDKALTDGLIIVGIAWAVLLFLVWSLRSFNI